MYIVISRMASIDRIQIPKGDLTASGRMHICSFDNSEQIPFHRSCLFILEVSGQSTCFPVLLIGEKSCLHRNGFSSSDVDLSLWTIVTYGRDSILCYLNMSAYADC